jgi:hypothetical protein
MSFLVKTPTLPQSAAANDPKRGSGYKAAEVVPVGYGRNVYPSKWVSNKYDPKTVPGTDGRDRQLYSILAAYELGACDFLGFLFKDGKRIEGFDYTFSEHASPESAEFALTSESPGRLILHRGTEDTPLSAVDSVSAKTGQQHPPMRGYVWAEWIDIDFTNGVPSFALELGTPAPAVGVYGGGQAHPYGVNPFAAIYALCRLASAGDFNDALLDPAHWGAQAQALEDVGVAGRTGNFTHCHPEFTASTTLGDALSQILAYVDGYLYAKDGKLCVGWFPNAAVDAGALPEIAEADLEKKPNGGGFPDWNDGATSVVVVFKSFAKDYDDDAARYNAPANRENNVTAEPARRERPFVHDKQQAAMIAAEGAGDPSGSEISTNLTVLKSRAVTLMPGTLVNWDYAPHSLDLVCRVTSRRIRFGAASDIISVTRERGAYPRPYVAPQDERVLPDDTAPGEITSGDVRLWFMPTGFGATRQVAALINRPNRSDAGALLYLSVNGSAPWSQILDQRYFAAKVTVSGSGISDSAGMVEVQSTSLDFDNMPEQDAVAQADDALCLLLGNEVLSVGTITSVATNTWDLSVLRARRGSEAAGHAAASVGWLFRRSSINPATHAEFYAVRDGSNVYDSGIATKYFKVALFTGSGEKGAAKPNDPGLSITLPDLTADEVATAYTVLLSSEAHTVACDSAGNVIGGQLGAGSTAKTTVTVLRNNTPLTAVNATPGLDEFSITVGTLTAATATKEAFTTVRCDTLTADTGIIEIDVTIGAIVGAITKKFTLTKAKAGTNGSNGANGSNGSNGSNGTNGTDGVRGSKTFYAATTGSTWSDSEANTAITAAGFTRVTIDTVTLYNTAAGFSETRFWNGSAWLVVTQVIDGNLVVHGTIGSDHLVAGISISAPIITGGIVQLTPVSGGATLCSTTADGSDNALVRINGGGSDGPTRGGQVDVFGNEYTAIAGYGGNVLLTPGSVSSGKVRLRDYLGNDRVVTQSSGVDLNGAVNVSSTLTVASGGLVVTGSSNIYSGGLGVANQVIAGTYLQAGTYVQTQGGTLGLVSSRHELAASGSNSIALATSGTQRWIVGGSDGHLKTLGAYDIRKASSDGWTVLLNDGTNTIEFQVSGGHLWFRYNGGAGIQVTF